MANLELIEKIKMVDREAIHIFVCDMIWATLSMENYVKHLKVESSELTDNLIEIEHYLSHMKSTHVSELLDVHV